MFKITLPLKHRCVNVKRILLLGDAQPYLTIFSQVYTLRCHAANLKVAEGPRTGTKVANSCSASFFGSTEDAALLIFALCTSALDLGVTTFVLGHKMFMKRVRTFSFSERGGQCDILARSRPISVDVDPTPKCLALGLRTFSFSSNHLLLASWIEPCSWFTRVGTIGVCRKKWDTTTWHLFFWKATLLWQMRVKNKLSQSGILECQNPDSSPQTQSC